MAIPLLSLEEFTSVVLPSNILTDEEQLHIFKAITIPYRSSSCGKFRVGSRKGGRIVEVSVNEIVFPTTNRPIIINLDRVTLKWTNLQSETLSVKTNKRSKIKSITIKPRFEQKGQHNFNFKVDIDIVTRMQNLHPGTHGFDRSGIETEEGTLNETFEGRHCKIPIDRVIHQNEILVLTIKPYLPSQNYDIWEPDQHMVKTLPLTPSKFNGMMYQHKISKQTTLYLSLEGGHLVKSFEVMEMC